jgi:hypothetical protein
VHVPPIRAPLPVAVGEGDFNNRLIQPELHLYCGGNFNDDDSGPFNDVKYLLGLFNGEPSYFTGSQDLEIRG